MIFLASKKYINFWEYIQNDHGSEKNKENSHRSTVTHSLLNHSYFCIHFVVYFLSFSHIPTNALLFNLKYHCLIVHIFINFYTLVFQVKHYYLNMSYYFYLLHNVS